MFSVVNLTGSRNLSLKSLRSYKYIIMSRKRLFRFVKESKRFIYIRPKSKIIVIKYYVIFIREIVFYFGLLPSFNMFDLKCVKHFAHPSLIRGIVIGPTHSYSYSSHWRRMCKMLHIFFIPLPSYFSIDHTQDPCHTTIRFSHLVHIRTVKLNSKLFLSNRM